MYWIPVYAIAVIIFYFSSLSQPIGSKVGGGFSSWFLHIVEYGLLGVAAYLAFKNDNNFKYKRMSTILFVVMFAITDEIHQLMVPGRVGSFFDIGIDSIAGFTITLFV